MTRRQLVAAWAVVSLGFVGMAAQMSLRTAYFQHHGVPVVAKLISYHRYIGRGHPPSVYGCIRFQVGDDVVNSTVFFADRPDRSDPMFSRITAAGRVPVLYDPKHPASVVLDYDGSAYRSRPEQVFLKVSGFGLGVMALVFLPLLAMQRQGGGAGRDPPTPVLRQMGRLVGRMRLQRASTKPGGSPR